MTGTQPSEDFPPRGLLSRDELQQLLSPLGVETPNNGDREGPGLLVVSGNPRDAEAVARVLGDRRIAVIPSANPYRALDQFRRHPSLGVIVAVETLGAEGAPFVRRLRECNSAVRIGFICDEAAMSSAPVRELEKEGTLLPRPLATPGLVSFVELLPGGSAAHAPPAATHSAARRTEPSSEPSAHRTDHRTDHRTEPSAGPTSGGATIPRRSAAQPDPLAAVEALLGARLRGGAIEDGLRAWLDGDPALGGMVTFERGQEPGDFALRTTSREDDMAVAMLSDAVRLFARGEGPNPGAWERFLVFRDGATARRGVAMWCGPDAMTGELEQLCRRLEPVVALVEQVAGGVSPASGQHARDRVLELVATRIRSCERHRGRLALLIAEHLGNTDGAELEPLVRNMLRGSDWIAVDGARVYAVLDRPERGWRAAVGQRAKKLDEYPGLRLVGVAWQPPGEDASALMERGERILRERPGVPLLEVEESP